MAKFQETVTGVIVVLCIFLVAAGVFFGIGLMRNWQSPSRAERTYTQGWDAGYREGFQDACKAITNHTGKGLAIEERKTGDLPSKSADPGRKD